MVIFTFIDHVNIMTFVLNIYEICAILLIQVATRSRLVDIRCSILQYISGTILLDTTRIIIQNIQCHMIQGAYTIYDTPRYRS